MTLAQGVAGLRADVNGIDIQENIALSQYTTLMAGGPAAYFAEISDIDQMADTVAMCHDSEIPHIVLGSGSNVLASDRGFEGLVIVNSCKRMYFGRTQYIECGCWFQDVFLAAAQRGLDGLQFAVGIPGSLGGALVSNAGAYRANIADFLVEVEVVRFGKRQWVAPVELDFRYRDSILRRPSPPPIALLAVKMRLQPGDPSHIYEQAREYQQQRISKQPPHASAGSFFKNVISSELASALPNLPEKLRESGIVPAGFLIEACDMKDYRFGNVRVSSRHANFICNLGSASSSDIRKVADEARRRVLERFGVTLEEEVLYIGDWRDA